MIKRDASFVFNERRTSAKAFAKDVFINQEQKLGVRRRSDTVVVLTINYADYRDRWMLMFDSIGFGFRGEYGRKAET